MEANETQEASALPRDPSSISPSAYALLMMKRHTSIPYAREAAALLETQSIPTTAPITSLDVDPSDYWIRVMHFESRYWSINQLLADPPRLHQPRKPPATTNSTP